MITEVSAFLKKSNLIRFLFIRIFDILKMESITSTTHFEDILNTKEYVFVDFYAEWCMPCAKIAPEIEKLTEEYRRVTFVKVDCDKVKELANDFRVSELPTFILLRKGKIVGKIKGANVSGVQEMLKVLIQ